MANPTVGEIIFRMKPLSNPRWLDWRKMQYEHKALDGSTITIHYNGKWVDGVLKKLTNLNSSNHDNQMHL